MRALLALLLAAVAAATRFYTPRDGFPAHITVPNTRDGQAFATDVGSFQRQGSVRIAKVEKIRVDDANRAYKRSERPCNVFDGMVTFRYSDSAAGRFDGKQYLISAGPEGVIPQGEASVQVYLLNTYELTIELGRLYRQRPRAVMVYEYVPGRGWKRLQRVSLKVPC